MVKEYEGEIKAGMFVYILPENERRTSEYPDWFNNSDGVKHYTGRKNIEGMILRISKASGMNIYLETPQYINMPSYCYNKADCFVLGNIALKPNNGEEQLYIEELHKRLNIDTTWSYDSRCPYTVNGERCASEETLIRAGYIVYSVAEFKDFCRNNHIYLPKSIRENENQLQGEESSLRRGDESGKSGVCSGRHRIKFAVGHLSNKAFSVQSQERARRSKNAVSS